MSMQPRHPDERALHYALRDAFNEHLRNRNFFLWLDVRPNGRGSEFVDLDSLVRETEERLAVLDPDASSGPKHLPERWLHTPVADVKLRAIARKRSVRDRPPEEIVGNPEPILVGWQ